MYDMTSRLQEIDRVIAAGPYRDTWESLAAWRVPEKFRDQKFGIFIHWGIYSVPAFANEWYSRNMYIQGTPEFQHHVETYGPHTAFGYKDFLPMFRAEHFDPREWARLFAQAGARYVVPVAEHHDGFQMYRSDISHWNAYEMGPKRDVLGELYAACAEEGLACGASSHRIEHWWFMSHGKEFPSDIHEPMERGDFYWPAMPEPKDHYDLTPECPPSEEFLQDWACRTAEIIDRYQPKILYFDWWIQVEAAKPWLRKIAAYYYNRAAERKRPAIICYKQDAFFFGTAMPDCERGQFAEMKPYVWQTDTAIALNSWCWTESNQFRPAEDLVRDLIDIVSKNGTLLLNVGPKADGTISEEDTAILLRIGNWLQANGEAVYGTRPWRIYGEGPTKIIEGQFSDGQKKSYTSDDFRFTAKGGRLYVTAMVRSADGRYTIPSLGKQDPSHAANFHGIIRRVDALADGSEVAWTRDSSGLHLQAAPAIDDGMPVVFRVTID